jgi:Meiotically up-regulated gene 113
MVDRDYILAEIRRTAAENGGVALGRQRFATETGIREHDWSGRFWARWSDAVAEAGVEMSRMTRRFDDDAVMERLALATRRFGRLPTEPERRLLRREDPTFPSHGVFTRFGGQREQAARLAEFSQRHGGYADVIAALQSLIGPAPARARPSPDATPIRSSPTTIGEVYLLRVGRHYKVGRTNAFGRRERELAIQMPQRAETIHVIKTDDPVGIEAYWHARFAARRLNGEWFALTTQDVAAFRRRKFM